MNGTNEGRLSFIVLLDVCAVHRTLRYCLSGQVFLLPHSLMMYQTVLLS